MKLGYWAAIVAGLSVLASGLGIPIGSAVQPAGADTPYVSGMLSTNGPSDTSNSGRDLPGIYDSSGRFVLLHGVNAVYKWPPFVLYVDPGKAWNFDAADARAMSALGLNVVRLGILWEAIEPGRSGPNNPKICAKGTPGDPGQWNQAVADRYLTRVASTVQLLAANHIYTILDMHEDVYSQAFEGEGAPAWAVCTDGIPIKRVPGRRSNNYGSPSPGLLT